MKNKNIRRSMGVGSPPPLGGQPQLKHYSLFKWSLHNPKFSSIVPYAHCQKVTFHPYTKPHCLPRVQNTKDGNNAVILDVSATERCSRNCPNNDREQLQYQTRFSIRLWILLVPTENKTFPSCQCYQHRYERRDVHGENTH
jgi:hypothetical protein